jgi:hypothetical protein
MTPEEKEAFASRRMRRKIARWDEVELRLRLRQSADYIEAWYRRTYPDDEMVSAKTLRRYRDSKPPAWFISSTLKAEVLNGGEDRIRQVDVLTEQVELMELLKARIVDGRRAEEELSGLVELESVTDSITILVKLLDSHHQVLVEQGMIPMVARKLDVTAEHRVSYLSASDAARLQQLEKKSASGELDVLAFYDQMFPMFQAERAQRALGGR